MGDIAIIGGTGLCDPKMLSHVTSGKMENFYGTIRFTRGTYKGKNVIFLARHGKYHSIPPHLINYRANILGLKKLGVSAILSTTAVGAINPDDQPNDFVLPNQFIDFTSHSRHGSFFDGGINGVVHVDMTEPFCPTLREAVLESASDLGYDVHPTGTYVCTEGPRFETPTEIRMFGMLGGDVVGMTCVPEVCLAREAEMCYATISIVTNYAAGITKRPMEHKEVVEQMEQNAERLRRLILHTVELYDDRDCMCRHTLKEYGGFTI